MCLCAAIVGVLDPYTCDCRKYVNTAIKDDVCPFCIDCGAKLIRIDIDTGEILK